MIEIKNVRLNHFPESSLSLSVNRGEIVGIAGPNGSGKTTLLRYLAGIEPAGITVNGAEQQHFFQPEKNLPAAIVFQHAEDNLIFSTLREDIRFGLRCQGKKLNDRDLQDILSLCDLRGYEDRPYGEMSGSELERAALASILSQKPELLLLDEVFSARSGPSAVRVLEKVLRHARAAGTTVILASHAPELLRLCGKVLRIEKGSVLSDALNASEEYSHTVPFEELLSKSMCTKTMERVLSDSGLLLTEYVQEPTEKVCLQLDEVSYAHPARNLFDSLSCLFRKGALYHLTGPSGSGKSTFLQIMAGLLYVSSGEVRVFDQLFPHSGKDGWGKIGKVHHQSYLNELRRRIGFAGQHADRQLFCKTVWDDVGFAPRNFCFDGGALKDMQTKALNRMGIHESLWDRPSMQLSIGEQRKAALAGVLAADPQILLLDTPYAELDQDGINALNRVILDHLSAGGTVVIAEGM